MRVRVRVEKYTQDPFDTSFSCRTKPPTVPLLDLGWVRIRVRVRLGLGLGLGLGFGERVVG